TERWNTLDDDVRGHETLRFDHPESRLDPGQPRRVFGYLGGQLRAAEPQHAVQLLRPYLLLEDLPHLFEAEAEILERDQPVEPGQLSYVVVAIAGDRVDPSGAEQAECVVVP